MSAIIPVVIILFLLTILGAPLFVVILAVALIGFYALGIDLSVIAIEIYRLADTPLLVALPLFTFTGYLMAKSRTSERLVRLTREFLGWMPGGLAIVSLVACAVFTAFTGASGVTIVALGALLYPAMVQDGYRERFSLGLVTTSGSLGLLFPPSLPLILYGVIAQQIGAAQGFTLEDLFWGGLLPGSLMVALLSGWTLWSNRHIHTQRTRFSIRSALQCPAGVSLGDSAACFSCRWNLRRICCRLRGGGRERFVCAGGGSLCLQGDSPRTTVSASCGIRWLWSAEFCSSWQCRWQPPTCSSMPVFRQPCWN